jgi:tetratricopeptide (TPR) repeat protein
MRKTFSIFLFTFLAFGLFSCLSKNSNDLKAIAQKETVFKGKHDSAKLAIQLDESYRTFIRKYPSDTNIPRMLFEDAQLNIYPLRKTDAALNQLEDLYTKYPDSRFSANAMFKAAFLNENVLGRTEAAKALYLQFIKTYPDNSLASDARLSVDNIGLSPAAQLKKIQEKQDSLKKGDMVKK